MAFISTQYHHPLILHLGQWFGTRSDPTCAGPALLTIWPRPGAPALRAPATPRQPVASWPPSARSPSSTARSLADRASASRAAPAPAGVPGRSRGLPDGKTDRDGLLASGHQAAWQSASMMPSWSWVCCRCGGTKPDGLGPASAGPTLAQPWTAAFCALSARLLEYSSAL